MEYSYVRLGATSPWMYRVLVSYRYAPGLVIGILMLSTSFLEVQSVIGKSFDGTLREVP